MEKQEVYLDNGATTKVDSEVVEVMNKVFLEDYGNASSLHFKGEKAKELLDKSREEIAKILNAEKEEIIFTSGGTESDNLAIKGLILKNKDKKHIITTPIEHHAVFNTLKKLDGFEIDYVKIDSEGFVDLKDLENKIRDDTLLVSIIHGNNEIGTVQDIKKIGEICKSKKVYFHTDAVQSFTKEKIDSKDADLISISAHKIHGPKGIGALFVRKGIKLTRVNDGGGQEFEMRAGTESIPLIVGFAKAACLMTNLDKMKELRDYFISEIEKRIKGSKLNGPRKNRLVNNINMVFPFVEGESMLYALSEEGICVSTGSACSSKRLKASHVLTGIGLKAEDSHCSIRFTLSKYTTKEEIDYTLDVLEKAYNRLREVSSR